MFAEYFAWRDDPSSITSEPFSSHWSQSEGDIVIFSNGSGSHLLDTMRNRVDHRVESKTAKTFLSKKLRKANGVILHELENFSVAEHGKWILDTWKELSEDETIEIDVSFSDPHEEWFGG